MCSSRWRTIVSSVRNRSSLARWTRSLSPSSSVESHAQMRLFRSFVVALALSCSVIAYAPMGATAASAYLSTEQAPAAAQADDRLAAAADAARELSVLEAERDFDALYERMHPDALAVVPRSAVVGW